MVTNIECQNNKKESKQWSPNGILSHSSLNRMSGVILSSDKNYQQQKEYATHVFIARDYVASYMQSVRWSFILTFIHTTQESKIIYTHYVRELN